MSTTKVCVLPWNHTFVSNSKGVYPCCLSQRQDSLLGSLDGLSLDPTRLQRLKNTMLEGRLPASCQSCIDAENVGKKSYRQFVNSWFPETLAEIISDRPGTVETEYLDIRLGNVCNLKCRMCHPSSSILLAGDFEEFYPGLKGQLSVVTAAELQRVYSGTNSLKRILFAGGEPFLSDTLSGFLDFLILQQKADKIDLSFATNLTVFPKDLIAKLRQFKSVHISGSLDGLGDVNHYIRYPSNWAQILQNLKSFLAEGFSFSANHTVQIYNVFSIVDFLQFFENEMKLRVDLNFLAEPRHLNIQNLPAELKSELNARYDSGHPQIARLLDYMNLRQLSDWNIFWLWTDFLDSKRNQKLTDIIPGSSDWPKMAKHLRR